MHWLSILALAGSAAAGSCPRAFLESLTSQYLAAQTAGDPALFPSLAPNGTFIENDVKLARSLCDPHAPGRQHATWHVAAVDSVVTRPGDWAFNATGYLYWDSHENWAVGPYEKVATDRAALQAAADEYFDRFDNTSVVIPLGTPCARLKGGAYTGRGNLTADACDIGGFPNNIKVTNQKYIVDEAAGVVDIFEGFPGLDRSEPTRPVPDSHLFRIINGTIRYIHTVSHCFNTGCGMNGTLFGKRSAKW
ncbi:hypothetical protein SCUCBS95973_001962 [Sporothrix curviconia]|uniref:DUF8021 domain-containing protein n=1 Tax=Sporothrix curviconia TaxID=1260050 RepID=A0ABP0B3U4_9PEZI